MAFSGRDYTSLILEGKSWKLLFLCSLSVWDLQSILFNVQLEDYEMLCNAAAVWLKESLGFQLSEDLLLLVVLTLNWALLSGKTDGYIVVKLMLLLKWMVLLLYKFMLLVNYFYVNQFSLLKHKTYTLLEKKQCCFHLCICINAASEKDVFTWQITRFQMLELSDHIIFILQVQTMKETYLPELKEMYEKIATKLQQVC